jgi:hypothetical protein
VPFERQKFFALNLGHRFRANEEADRQIKRKEARTAINNGTDLETQILTHTTCLALADYEF